MMGYYKEPHTKELIQQAHILIDLDKKIVRAVVESDFEKIPSLISKFRDTKISVLKKFSELSVVENVDDETRQVLDRVQREFPTDNVIRHLEKNTGTDSSFFELSWEEAGEIGSDLLYSWNKSL
jgi:23S rRNA-/tRNA-specific pseudouridylate synthase